MVLGVCLDFVVGLVLGIWFGFWLWVLNFGCFQRGLIWLCCFEVCWFLVFGFVLRCGLVFGSVLVLGVGCYNKFGF